MTSPNVLDALVDALVEAVVQRMAAKNTNAGPSSKAQLLSVRQAAEILGRPQSSIRKMMHDGTLPMVRMGSRTLIHRKDLDAAIEAAKGA